jgi:hypothetical protein
MAREEESCSNRQNRLDGWINKWGNVTSDLYGRCGALRVGRLTRSELRLAFNRFKYSSVANTFHIPPASGWQEIRRRRFLL